MNRSKTPDLSTNDGKKALKSLKDEITGGVSKVVPTPLSRTSKLEKRIQALEEGQKSLNTKAKLLENITDIVVSVLGRGTLTTNELEIIKKLKTGK